jgi:hypothetical protein
MQNKPINTFPLQQFIEQVKIASMSQQREIKLDIHTAKTLALTIGEVSVKLLQDYDQLLTELKSNDNNDIVELKMDGGGFSQ